MPFYTTFVQHTPLMATRSRIGIELPNGLIRSVYCHWDGYPEHHGKILLKHYSQRENVEKLIAGGGISSLHTRQTWESGSVILTEDGKYATDEFGSLLYQNDREAQPLYYTERGEELKIQKGSFHEFATVHSSIEYVYLFTMKNQWECYGLYGDEPNPVSLEEFMP